MQLALHNAILENNRGHVRLLLRRFPALADSLLQSPRGCLPAFIFAASYGLADIVRELLRHGANPNACAHGRRAIDFAIFSGCSGAMAVVEILVDVGADLSCALGCAMPFALGGGAHQAARTAHPGGQHFVAHRQHFVAHMQHLFVHGQHLFAHGQHLFAHGQHLFAHGQHFAHE